MLKRESDFGKGTVVFAEDIKLTLNEHDLPEIWVSSQFLGAFLAHAEKNGRRVLRKEILHKSNSGNLVDIYAIVLAKKEGKKEVVEFIRAFLNSIETDWFETSHVDSDDPDFEFVLPEFSVWKLSRRFKW